MEGHRVVCCFTGTWDSQSTPTTASGCQEHPALQECLDPDQWDQDASGTLSDSELATFCLQKCSPGWDAGTTSSPNWKIYSGTKGTWFDSCTPYVGGQLPFKTHIDGFNTCNPSEVKTYGEEVDVPPTHEGAFVSGSTGSTVDLTMLGEPFSVAYELYVQFVLDQCDASGLDGGTCRIVLSGFDMTTTSPIQVGEYWAIDGSLTLNAPVEAWVSFSTCSRGQCTGTFNVSSREGNPIGVNLFWTQRSLETGSIDEGALHLGNGAGALGGVEALTGELTLDRSGSIGTLRLVGGGEDALGGDFATADFDIVGSVTPL